MCPKTIQKYQTSKKKKQIELKLENFEWESKMLLMLKFVILVVPRLDNLFQYDDRYTTVLVTNPSGANFSLRDLKDYCLKIIVPLSKN